MYATLTLLLRAKSKHFAATIDKQEFAFNPAVKAKIAVPVTKSDKSIDKTPVVEEEKRHEIMETHSASVRKAEHRSAAPKQQPAVATNTEGAKKKKTAVKKYQQALGPSSKWRWVMSESLCDLT